jgi:hypothetical protein
MGQICCPETSVKDYHTALRNGPEERGSHQSEVRSLNRTWAAAVTADAEDILQNLRSHDDHFLKHTVTPCSLAYTYRGSPIMSSIMKRLDTVWHKCILFIVPT